MALFRYFMVITGFLALCSVEVRADVFTISDVSIDGYGASVTDARKAAIQSGTEEAANLLIERLTLQSDRYEVGWEPISADIATQLVAGIQIQNERRSDRRYLGVLQVSFDRQRVRDFLNARQIPFVEAQKANALILPVWNGPEGKALWRENLWWQTWVNANPEHDLTPLTLPLADLGDRQAVTVRQAVRQDSDALRQLASRYDVQQVIVAVASIVGPGRVGVRVNLTSWDAAGGVQTRQLRVYGDGNDMGSGTVALASAYKRAQKDIVIQLEQAWKNEAVVRSGSQTNVRLTATFSSLAEWRRISEALAKSPLVREARLEAISNDGALMTLTYVGTVGQLTAQLAQSGVVFVNTEIGPVARLR